MLGVIKLIRFSIYIWDFCLRKILLVISKLLIVIYLIVFRLIFNLN